MNSKVKSIRPFIGAKDFNISRAFYQEIGFEESVITHNLSYFKMDAFGFYLQDAYVKDWVDNTMVFMEVSDTKQFYQDLLSLNLSDKYTGVRLVPIKELDWGRECFLHDPSGILWHFGSFN
ncbi:MAG: glyoxalase [Sphingobacteriales bacterium]|nr:glyoxalase [Sphingobacteriales bacterium]